MNNPPIAKVTDHTDPYDWLRDKNWPKVEDKEILNYVEAENEYFRQATEANKQLEEKIYQELKDREKEDDDSYPVKRDNYYYFFRKVKDKEYYIICRNSDKGEEILLDGNSLAEGKSSFSLGATAVSKDHSKLAYAYDADGSERYTIEVKNLETNLVLEDKIDDTLGGIVWNKEGSGFYYLRVNENWRPDKVFFHSLGSKKEKDILIYHEKDSGFYVDIDKTSSENYLIIACGNGSSSEDRYLSLDDSSHDLKKVIRRKKDQLYSLDHINGIFYLLINDKGKNFRLVRSDSEFKNFFEIIPHSEDYYLTDISLYNEYLVVSKRVLGLNKIEYYDIKTCTFISEIALTEEVYQANIIHTSKDDKYLRVSYSSLTTPSSILEYEFENKKLHIRKVDEVKGYEQNKYLTKRLWADSKDGVKIPISIVYHKDKVSSEKTNPILLYGYGSYGAGMSAYFRPSVISLLDRGFIYAIAHIRGGDELGFDWYESAKFLNKKRTFEDFITSAEYLIKEKYTSASKLAIMGGSAGGLLMGAVVNQRPDLFKAVIAMVPFVDVLSTMLDESLPLTPMEFEEWGNPKDKDFYEYMKSYSPYDNVTKQNYPNILVTAGLTDPRVGYWEAAKWVAKLRKYKQDDNLLILKTDMDAGHAGKSGRFKRLEEMAMIYSFILSVFGLS